MDSDDKDFRINHEQLLKIVKVMLHQQNLLSKKTKLFVDNQKKEAEALLDARNAHVQSLVDESRLVVHSVHQEVLDLSNRI